MNVLAIDTSNETLGVAIVNKEKVVGEYITNIKKNHSVRVMPTIDRLLNDCDLTIKDIGKIVVAKGPGSYTGVRIGVTIAKTLAWSLQIPLVGVSSLAVLASSGGRYFNGLICPLFDARRGQIYTSLYQFVDGTLKQLEEDQILQSKDWAIFLKERNCPILFIGNDLLKHQSIFKAVLGEYAIFANISEHNPRPSELALLGMDLEGEEVHTFVPNYIRLAEAESKWLEANKNKS